MLTTDIALLSQSANEKIIRNAGKILVTTTDHPLYYRMITKCGCTYILNILYFLETAEIHPNPTKIHSEKKKIRSAMDHSDAQITNSPFSFIVIRNPVDRFLSLYFDKIYAPSPFSRHYIGKLFAKDDLVNSDPGITVDQHYQNCINSIKWIKDNLAGKTTEPSNWHWRPQTVRLKQVAPFKFNVLTLDDITYQLPKVLTPIIPNIAQIMQDVSAYNDSFKPVNPIELVDQSLRDLINATYPEDHAIYSEVSTYWQNIKTVDA